MDLVAIVAKARESIISVDNFSVTTERRVAQVMVVEYPVIILTSTVYPLAYLMFSDLDKMLASFAVINPKLLMFDLPNKLRRALATTNVVLLDTADNSVIYLPKQWERLPQVADIITHDDFYRN